MFDSMSLNELHTGIIENTDRGIATINKLNDVCEDKHLIIMIRECFEQIADYTEQAQEAVPELDFND